MKTILLITLLFIKINLYGTSYKEFIQNNEIKIIIRKIPYEKTNENNRSHRYPFDEYYFSNESKVLKIICHADRVWKNEDDQYINNGFFRKQYIEETLPEQKMKKFNRLMELYSDINFDNEKFAFTDDKLYILELGKSSRRRPGTYMYNELSINRRVISDHIDTIYEIEIKDENLSFVIIPDEKFYPVTSKNFQESIGIIRDLADYLVEEIK